MPPGRRTLGGVQPAGQYFTRRVVRAVGIVALGALLAASTVLAVELLLLTFGSILLAIVLRGLADWLASWSRLSPGLAYAAVLLGLLALGVAGAWLLAPSVVEQFAQLEEQLPELLEQARRELSRFDLGRELLRQLRRLQREPQGQLEQVAGFASMSLSGLAYLLFFVFTGIYLGASPALYVGGLVRLVPVARRERARQVLGSLGHALRWFMLGRLVSMFVVGLLTGIMLHLLGVPLAVLLGLTAGLLTFVPYAGPITAGVPIGLVALVAGPTRALTVLLIYTVIQSLEGFIITPLVQQRAVSIAPALTLFAEFLMGMLVGPLGVVLSVPLAAAVLVLIRELYIEGFLEGAPGPGPQAPGRRESG